MKQTNDGLTGIIEEALAKMPELGEWQKRFLTVLFSTLLLLKGQVNFSSLARHSDLSERTYRRGFRREFDFERFNLHCVCQRAVKGTLVAALDASYVPKSGKQTYGLGNFYSGCLGRAVKGLEISELALIDRESRQAFAFSTRQTVDASGRTRPEFYAEHVKDCAPHLPKDLKHLLVDGYYTKKHFVDTVCGLERGLELVGKLRCDANLRYFYYGAYAGMGRPKRYDGKVDFDNLSRFVYEGELAPQLHLYAQTLWHVSLKRTLRVVLLLNTSKAKPRYVLLFSTDLSLTGRELVELYRLRFQIEFLFRDAKQFTGLTDCQARDKKALHFHFNAALSAVNLAKLDLLSRQLPEHTFVFSLSSYVHRAFSHRLLSRLLSNLDLDLSCPKVKHAFSHALAFGAASP
jgi:hypothetical protein